MSSNCTSTTTQTNSDINEHLCLSQNPLVRDGVSQLQRLLNTLLPSYVKVDELIMKDLVHFVNKLSKEKKFVEFDGALVLESDWEDFFDLTDEEWDTFDLETFIKNLKSSAETQPHMALFLGFLFMFKIAQEDLNTITRRHLDFYYREVLQLVENPALPDQAAVIFKLAKNAAPHLIKEGTKLKGGKDDLGVERIYEVTRDIVINKATIADKKALFANIHDRLADDNPGLNSDHRLFASPIASSSDGEGEKIENEEQSWRTFGEPTFTDQSGTLVADRNQPFVGFAFASPILFMKEGTRNVKIEIEFDSPISAGFVPAHDHFLVNFSGEEEWIAGAVATGDVTTASGPKLIIQRTIAPDLGAIVKYDKEILLQPFETNWPVVKIELNPEHTDNPFIYKYLKDLVPTTIKITVDVDEVVDVVLQNDQAVIDPSKPFLPFGNRPYVGSKFYIGSWEVFQKNLSDLRVKFRWNDLPEGNFSDHYTNYELSTDKNIIDIVPIYLETLTISLESEMEEVSPPYASTITSFAIESPTPVPSNVRKNNSFKLDVDILDKKEWVQLSESETALFTDKDGNAIANGNDLPGPNADRSMLVFDDSDSGIEIPERDETLANFDEWDVNSQKGFIRLRLQGVDFGHSDFANAYARQAIELSKEIPSDWAQLPNPPYTPSMQELSLSYASEVEFYFVNENPSTEKKEQFLNLG